MKKGLIYGIGAGIGAAGLAIGAGVATIIIKGEIKKAEEERVKIKADYKELKEMVQKRYDTNVELVTIEEKAKEFLKKIEKDIEKSRSEKVKKNSDNIKRWFGIGDEETKFDHACYLMIYIESILNEMKVIE